MGPILRAKPKISAKTLEAVRKKRRAVDETNSSPGVKSVVRNSRTKDSSTHLAKLTVKPPAHTSTSSIPKPSNRMAASPRQNRASTAQLNRLQKLSARMGKGGVQPSRKTLPVKDKKEPDLPARHVNSEDDEQVERDVSAVQDQAQLLESPNLSGAGSEDLPATITLRNRTIQKLAQDSPRQRGHKAASRFTTDNPATATEDEYTPSTISSEELDMQQITLESLLLSPNLASRVAQLPPSRSAAAAAAVTFSGNSQGEWSPVPDRHFPIYVDDVLQVPSRSSIGSSPVEDKENVSPFPSSSIRNPPRVPDPFADFPVLGPRIPLGYRGEGVWDSVTHMQPSNLR
ncbi:hypothetical protein AOQ84DRAFT_363894 [Glonium stellatum]|uniref:Uncharacterized protein n=1 Tax=Glonium stellatum TaxID=574774 RepID=A0A8E2JT96_9PEZI|nr:hypothetical protein AOQ84DRAFT_363894 [Glonium stellatum]